MIRKNSDKRFFILFSFMAFYVLIMFIFDYKKISFDLFSIEILYIPIILSTVIFSIFLKSERQRMLLKLGSMNISIKDSFIIFTAGQSLLITPGGVGSVIKSKFFKDRYGYELSKTIPIIFYERYLDMIGILSIISVVLIFDFHEKFAILAILVGILITSIYFLIRNKTLFNKCLNLVQKLPFLSTGLNDFSKTYSFIQILTSKKSLKIVWPLSMLCWFLDAVVIYLSFQSFHLEFNFFETTLIGFTAFLLGIVSMIPGGLGITELSMIDFVNERGVALSVGAGLVLFNRLVSLWFSTLLGFIFTKIALKGCEKKY